jgi:helicase
VVVIGFSGHGTDTHELVTYDTRRDDLAGTTILLSVLAEWFARIPARRLVLLLDCCFSGGALASRVAQVNQLTSGDA